MAVEWNGDEIIARVQTACVEAVNETTAAAVELAKQEHWWTPETGHLEENTVSEPAVAEGSVVSGKFGTTRRKGFYGLFLEYKEPFLRPVADQVFPTLAERVRDKL